MKRYEFVCNQENEKERIDVYLTNAMSKSRNYVQKLFDDNCVLINDKIKPKNYKLKNKDIIIVNVNEPKELELVPQQIALDIVYEDNDLLVINKPKGMVVHPAPGHSDNTLVNALLGYAKDSLSGINGVIRPGIVHRIDKDTSGLLLVAKNDNAHRGLASQLKTHEIKRQYHAIVVGNIKEDGGIIDKPIGRHQTNRKSMAVTYRNSKPAVTHFKVIERLNGFTHVVCDLETGRTHQIRVHLKSLGHPIAGDKLYGNKGDKSALDSQALCATKLEFKHPVTNEHMEFNVDLPEYFKGFLQKRRGR